MSMIDSRSFPLSQQQQQQQHVTRKPLPEPPTSMQPSEYLPQHQQQQHQQPPYYRQQQQPQQLPLRQAPPPAAIHEDQQPFHNRSRTASSSIFPQMTSQEPQPPPHQIPQNMNPVPYQPRVNQHAQPSSRRTLSSATSSTSSTSNIQNQNVPMRQNSGGSSDLARTASSTSSTSHTSYVALMRKQKATVWSDRTQHEDPRMVAQQRLAKQRALREVTSTAVGARVSTSASGTSSITGGVRSKIRHHGAPMAQRYAPGTLSASGVPVRLSQNEIDEDEGADDSRGGNLMHRRTDSGRSSFGSGGQVGSMYTLQQGAGGAQHGVGTGTTPPSGGQSRQSPVDYRSAELGSADETPVPGRLQGGDYFGQSQVTQAGLARAGSGGSGSTGREDSFGAVGKLPERTKPVEEKLDPAELRRRGSVDERTMTMSGYGKLFVANPDVDD